MTPKEAYEARKKERHRRRDARETLDMEAMDIEALDILDRIATAFERIADAMETKS